MKNYVDIKDEYWDYAEALTPYGVEVRYPGGTEISEAETELGLKYAEALYMWAVEEIDKFEDMFPGIFDKNKAKEEVISENVYNDFLNYKCIKLHDRKTMLDYWFCVIAFIYDLNFDLSLKYVKENNYINKLIDRLEYHNPDTKIKVESLRKAALEYLDTNKKKL